MSKRSGIKTGLPAHNVAEDTIGASPKGPLDDPNVSSAEMDPAKRDGLITGFQSINVRDKALDPNHHSDVNCPLSETDFQCLQQCENQDLQRMIQEFQQHLAQWYLMSPAQQVYQSKSNLQLSAL